MHMRIHKVAAAAGIACAWLLANAAFSADAAANWKPLFNGKNLKGWSVHYAPVGEIVRTRLSNGADITWCYVRDPEGNILELQAS